MLVKSDPAVDLLHFRMRRGLRVQGTCTWLWQAEKVSSWIDSHGCQFLYLTGNAGTGKTEAALYLLDTIESRAKAVDEGTPYNMAHFFCSSKDATSLNELEILRSLLFQLCRRTELLRYVEEAFSQYSFPKGGLLDDFDALWLVLIAILQDSAAAKVVIILDAVDNCALEVCLNLCQHFEFMCSGNASGQISAKILITCRDIATIPLSVREIGAHLPLAGYGLRRDLDMYIMAKAEELSDRMAYPEAVQQQLILALQKRNNGTFLWLALVMKHLQTTDTRAPDLIRRLEELPGDLAGLYDQILARVSPQAISHVCFILHILCAAHREMTKDEVLLGYCLHRRTWANDTMPDFRQYEYLILDRTDLVVFDPERETLSLLHDTVLEYLTESVSSRSSLRLAWIWDHFKRIQSQAAEFLTEGPAAQLLLRGSLVRTLFHVDHEQANYVCFEVAFKTLGLTELRQDEASRDDRSLRKYSEEFLQLHASASWSILSVNFPWSDQSWTKDHARLFLWLAQAARLDSRCLTTILDGATDPDLPVNCERVDTLSSLLVIAAESGNVASMEVLISSGADVDPEVGTPLYAAAMAYHVDGVKLLIAHGADVDRRHEEGLPLLLQMLGTRSESIVCKEVQVQDRAQLVAANAYSSTSADFLGAIHSSSQDGGPNSAYQDVVLALMLASANLEQVDHKDRTPLIRAAGNRQWLFVRRLIELGADVDALSCEGSTPLLAATGPPRRTALFKDVTVRGHGVAFLGGIVIDQNTFISFSDGKRKSDHHRKPALQALINKVGDLEATDADGRSALLLAAESGEPWLVERLLAAGAKFDALDAKGFTPLMLACRLPRFWNIVVKNLSVLDNATVYAGGVFLRRAIEEGANHQRQANTAASQRLQTVETLLNHGTNPNIMAYDGDTALSLAITDNLQEIVELLLIRGACNASFSLTREAMLQRFTYRDTVCTDHSRLHVSGSGGSMQFSGFEAAGDSRVHFGGYSSLVIPHEQFFAKLAKVAPLCPATLFHHVGFYGRAKVLLGVEDVSFLNTDDAHNFDSALACPIPFQNITIQDYGRWHFAIDILPDWNPLCRPKAADFSALPRCHFQNITVSDHGKVELGNSAFVEHEGTVFAVTSQYPGNSFRDITVQGRGRLRTCAFTAGSANGVALRVFKKLKKIYLEDDKEDEVT